MLTGEYNVSIDEKGRTSIPSRLKNELDTSTVFITKSSDARKCLQVLKVEDFNKLAERLLNGTYGEFSNDYKILQMRIIAPAQEMQFDKAGRVMIPQSLRAFAGIELKSEIIIIGMVNRLEIWNKEEYENCISASDDPEKILKAANTVLANRE